MSTIAFNAKQDIFLIFAARIIRMFTYGMISVTFIQNLYGKGFTTNQVSFLQFCILIGDVIISLILTTNADKIGRRSSLMVGAIFKFISGVIYSYSNNYYLLVIAGIIGVITVTGGQIGPFLPVEQSILAQLIEQSTVDKEKCAVNISKYYGYFNMSGYLSLASGAAFAGFYISFLNKNYDIKENQSSNHLILFNGCLGLLMSFVYYMLDPKKAQINENKIVQKNNFLMIRPENIRNILLLSCLFALDAFAAGFIAQSYLSYFFQMRFDLKFDSIGMILSLCSIISALSGVISSKIVQKIGCVATMICSHLPSHIFLLIIPFSSSASLAIILLLCRFSISQMDVPARQTFISLLVSNKERSSANGITNLARSIGLSIGVTINSQFLHYDKDSFMFGMPFIISGGTQMIYDIALALCFLKTSSNIKSKKEILKQA